MNNSKRLFTDVGNDPFFKVKGNAPQKVDGFNGGLDAHGKLRNEIEPWLTALFQSEHLSLLIGTGLSYATHRLVSQDTTSDLMSSSNFISDGNEYKKLLEEATLKSAKSTGREKPNIEDWIRVTNEFIRGMEMYVASGVRGTQKLGRQLDKLKKERDDKLKEFMDGVLMMERNIVSAPPTEDVRDGWNSSSGYLTNFLMSFACHSATKERLNIFTTNYDRLIEYGAELAGMRLMDRFVGTVNPVFRSSRIDVDMHYDPPGIRGEPRYLEGVVRFTKLHGSLDWVMRDRVVRRIALPYGATSAEQYGEDGDTLLIYPNEAKDRETAEYPYVELFRDFAAAICRPNTTLVVYGYSFGDSHINRVIKDMLTIPSAHLVIIGYDDTGRRIKKFYDSLQRKKQVTLLIGKHLAGLKPLVDHYLPNPSIDRTAIKMAELQKARGLSPKEQDQDNGED